ncbi:Signal recognition particle 54 kDa protein [Quillaja saponaria]|uniref:Signal recognition particle 54 kDa protein n=1 Tax=Quillaja saponaria TaxID=32244 RepID=A0AAD7LRN7_QUISA|nr:Signal recognition particle 54 kDa protein [Quillaja saponaria]
MVLAELGGSISLAIKKMTNATIIDEKVLNKCLNDITRALLKSEVKVKLYLMNSAECWTLGSLLSLQKKQNKCVMFVGLQGSGKTTTCTKYAYYHKKKRMETCPSLCRYIQSWCI